MITNNRRWQQDNKERCRKLGRKWREKHNGYSQEWRRKHPELWKKYAQKAHQRLVSTVQGSLNAHVRAGIRYSLHRDLEHQHWETLVGYTLTALRAHLESLFTEGMTWEKVLTGEIHIDHVFPLARLVIDGPEDPTFKFAWSLENLRPLWASENLLRNDTVPWEFREKRESV